MRADGHTWRWAGYTALTACFLIGFFHRFAPATFADTIAASLGASATGLGILAAGHFWIYTAAQIPAGMVLDRYGARSSVAVASALVALGSVLLATAGGLVQATCGPILTGLGMSAVFVGVMRFNAEAFPAHRYGLVTGVTMLIANVGSIAAGSPAALLLEHWSWRTVFGVAGLVSAVLAVLVWAVVREPRDHPSAIGVTASPALAEEDAGTARRSARAAWVPRGVWPIFWATIGTNGTFYAFSGLWGVPMLTDGFGLSVTEAAAYTTLALTVYGLGAFAIGAVSDRAGVRKPFVVGCSVLAFAAWALLALAPWQPGWSGFLLYAMTGLAASQVTVSFATLKELVPTRVATALAVANTGVFAASAVIQPAFGWVLDHTSRDLGGYQVALALPIALAAAGLVAAWTTTETHCREQTVGVSDSARRSP